MPEQTTMTKLVDVAAEIETAAEWTEADGFAGSVELAATLYDTASEVLWWVARAGGGETAASRSKELSMQAAKLRGA